MRRLTADDGAMGVVVAVLGLAIFAMLAFSIDTGILLEERFELQNGADAGALAVAHTCGRGSCAPGDAETFADANARFDGNAEVESVNISEGAGTVHVITRSEAAGVELAAAKLFGQSNAVIRAQATARWGAAGNLSVTPWTISYCDLETAVADQGGYITIPPEPAGIGTVITFHDTTAAGPSPDPPCDAHPGFDEDGDGVLPGGFGKLGLDFDETCRVQTYTDDAGNVWAPVKEGVSAPPAWRCLELGINIIPIFADFRLLPSQKEYRITGYAAFYLTGYRMPSYSANPPCGGSESCISGWFTTATVPDGEFCEEPHCDFGVSVVKLTG